MTIRAGAISTRCPAIMVKALKEAGVTEDRYAVVPEEVAAIEAGLERARPGDLLVIFGDNLTRSWKQIIYFHNAAAAVSAQIPVVEEAPAATVLVPVRAASATSTSSMPAGR